MSTIVYLHAHPDDEASSTAASMARLSREGHRVVCVYGTNGDHGEVPDDLAEGDSLVAYRRREAEASAQVTGTARVEWLGYSDSGMTGWDQNGLDGAFHGADLDEAAGRLAAILDEEDADVLVGYDWHGTYGHPDHVKVHHVAHRAAELAARRPRVLEVTSNRDAMRRSFAEAKAAGLTAEEVGIDPGEWDPDQPMDDGNPFGTPESEITWRCDLRDLADVKRQALECHASQKTDIGMFMAMPLEVFREGFGYEHYIEPGVAGPMREAWPF
ncbi:PIG-L family deacetylase [Actinomycetota bacterium]|nr:PIG-L family deacetylase [Micrococcales bacterium]